MDHADTRSDRAAAVKQKYPAETRGNLAGLAGRGEGPRLTQQLASTDRSGSRQPARRGASEAVGRASCAHVPAGTTTTTTCPQPCGRARTVLMARAVGLGARRDRAERGAVHVHRAGGLWPAGSGTHQASLVVLAGCPVRTGCEATERSRDREVARRYCVARLVAGGSRIVWYRAGGSDATRACAAPVPASEARDRTGLPARSIRKRRKRRMISTHSFWNGAIQSGKKTDDDDSNKLTDLSESIYILGQSTESRSYRSISVRPPPSRCLLVRSTLAGAYTDSTHQGPRVRYARTDLVFKMYEYWDQPVIMFPWRPTALQLHDRPTHGAQNASVGVRGTSQERTCKQERRRNEHPS
jgi:hypothetical protein